MVGASKMTTTWMISPSLSWSRLIRRAPGSGWPTRGTVFVHVGRLLLGGRRVEDDDRVDDLAESLLEPVDQEGAGDRAATQLEEVVAGPDLPCTAESGPPEVGEVALQGGPGEDQLARRRSGGLRRG